MNEQTNKLQRPVKSSEIDFIQIGKRLWCERKTIFWVLGIGVVAGLLVAFISPREYKVTTTMLPQEESEGDLGNISSLASLAGFDLNLNSKSEISAVIYPQIVESAPFLLGILNAKYTFEKVNHPVTMYDYYTKINKPGLGDMVRKYTIGLPALLRKSMQGKVTVPVTGEDQRRDNITYLTKDQDELMVDLRKRMVLTLNKKEGYLTLTCTFEEPLLAAQVAAEAQRLLLESINGFKLRKTGGDLDFLEKRCREKKRDYENCQYRLADYMDHNQNLFASTAGAEQERLQNECNMAYSVYNGLVKQLEQAKIQVKNEAPAFTVIKPVVVPLIASAPKKTLIVLVSLMLGLVAGCGVVGVKEYVKIAKGRV